MDIAGQPIVFEIDLKTGFTKRDPVLVRFGVTFWRCLRNDCGFGEEKFIFFKRKSVVSEAISGCA